MGFLKKALPFCAGKPKFLVERGPWYQKAFKSMGVRFQRMTHGLRNSIEVLRAPQGEDKALPQLVPKSVQRRLDQKLDRRAQEHLPAEPPNHPNRGGTKLTVTSSLQLLECPRAQHNIHRDGM